MVSRIEWPVTILYMRSQGFYLKSQLEIQELWDDRNTMIPNWLIHSTQSIHVQLTIQLRDIYSVKSPLTE